MNKMREYERGREDGAVPGSPDRKRGRHRSPGA